MTDRRTIVITPQEAVLLADVCRAMSHRVVCADPNHRPVDVLLHLADRCDVLVATWGEEQALHQFQIKIMGSPIPDAALSELRKDLK